MADQVLNILLDYLENSSTDKVSEDVEMEVRKRFYDSLGVAVGAIKLESVKQLLSGFKGNDEGSSLWCFNRKINPLDAVFANGFEVRYLDFNDTYLSREPLHPSDIIPAIISMGENLNDDWTSIARSIAIGYQIGMALCDTASLRKHGWDHVNYIGLAAAASISTLLGLERSKASNAISIQAISNAAMRQTRVGELSQWKGAATANSCRNGAFSAMLASFGFTGPNMPFEGEMGFIKQLLNGEFETEKLEGLKGIRRILDSYIKPHPVEYHIQTAVDAAIGIRDCFTVNEIEYIDVNTYSAAYEIVVKDKWNPMNKETADHSMPYLIAYTLLKGEPWLDAYDVNNYLDPIIQRLMKIQRYHVNKEFDALYPTAIPTEIKVKIKGGKEFSKKSNYAVGHPKNPINNEMLKKKFDRLTAKYINSNEELYDMLIRSNKPINIKEVIELINMGE